MRFGRLSATQFNTIACRLSERKYIFQYNHKKGVCLWLWHMNEPTMCVMGL